MSIYTVPEKAKKYIDYDMIRAHTDIPEYSHHRTRLLYTFLKKSRMFRSYSELYALVTSLVQLGLDIHDRVDSEVHTSGEKHMRAKQLKILAGDYFSGHFYQLLSQAGQIDMIRKLSTAICDVNRIKMNFYMRMKQLKMSADDYLQHSVAIKSQLFLSFSHCIDELHRKEWPDLLHGFTSCEVLLEELERTQDLRYFQQSLAYWHLKQKADPDEIAVLEQPDTESNRNNLRWLIDKYNIRNDMLQQLHQTADATIQKIRSFDSGSLRNELSQLGESLINSFASTKLLKEV